MAYQSVHTGPEVDAAVSVLSDVQDIRDEVETNLNTVTTLAGQTATNAGLAQTAATNAQADAASALTSRNEAHTSAQAAAASAAASDAARAQSVVAKNGAEQARDSAWEAEDETRALLSESGPTIDAINAELRRMKYGSGPYPSLELGFVGASMLDRRVEFTRGSNATYWDPLGVLQIAGPNEPRFDYDPVTGESLGLLIEGQATNLLRWSEDFSEPPWVFPRSSITQGATIAPTGLLAAQKFVEGTDNGEFYVEQPRPTEAGKAYTFSIHAKSDGSDRQMALRMELNGSVVFRFNPATGIGLFTQNTGGGVSHSVTALPNGWWRIAFSFVAINTVPLTIFRFQLLRADGGLTYTGDGVTGAYIWGAQLEEGATPSSYTPTGNSQVTRAADLAVIDDLSWYNPEGGTLYAEGFAPTTTGVNIRTLVSLDNSTSAERIQLRKIPERAASAVMVHGGVVQANLSEEANAWPLSSSRKLAISFSASGMAFSVDGESPLFAGPVSLPDPTQLSIGSGVGAGTARLNGYIKRIAYYPRALSDAQLVELTSP